MKRILIIAAIIIMPVAIVAQQNSIDRVFQKYAGITGITSVQISAGMFGMLANIDSKDEDLNKLASSVNSVKILHASREAAKMMEINFYNEVLKDLPVERFAELMRVNSTDQQVLILADEDNGIINELLLLVGGESDNALISIKGKLDMKQISSLSNFGAPGMEHFVNMQK